MKLKNRLFIRDKNIKISNADHFEALYKNHDIYVSTKHGYPQTDTPGSKTFVVNVFSSCGGLAVDSLRDFKNIHEAILWGLEGALLIPSK